MLNLTESQRNELSALLAKVRTTLEKATENLATKLASRTQSLCDELAYCRDEINKELDAGRAPDFTVVDRAITVLKRLGALVPSGKLQLSDLPWCAIGLEMARRVDDATTELEAGNVSDGTIQHAADVLYAMTAPDSTYRPPSHVPPSDPISQESRRVLAELRGKSQNQILIGMSKGTCDPFACRMALNWLRQFPVVWAQKEDATGIALNLGIAMQKFVPTLSAVIRKRSAGEQSDARLLKELQMGFDAQRVSAESATIEHEVTKCVATGYRPPRFGSRCKALCDLIQKRSLARRVGLLR